MPQLSTCSPEISRSCSCSAPHRGYEALTMFAVRVHTHGLGRRVFMTRETWNKTGERACVCACV